MLVCDLCRHAGFDIGELGRYCIDHDVDDSNESVYPVCNTWPMGFSWSSFVAQSTLLEHCYAAGFKETQFLADDIDAPLCLDQTFFLATDDVMIFTRGDTELASRTAGQLDRALKCGGIVRSEEKDVTAACAEEGITCIGVDVCSGLFLAPSAKKLSKLFVGVLHFIFRSNCCIFPLGLAALLGRFARFAQLNRPLYSCFDCVYEFARRMPQDKEHPLPDACIAECLLFVALMPMLEADMQRE